MFLDDQLLEIGRNTELTDEAISSSINKIINACFANLQKGLGNNRDNTSILAAFNRVNKTWQKVAKILNEENRGFLKVDGFTLFVESRPEFKGIFFNKTK